jgi:hypothetical protein
LRDGADAQVEQGGHVGGDGCSHIAAVRSIVILSRSAAELGRDHCAHAQRNAMTT